MEWNTKIKIASEDSLIHDGPIVYVLSNLQAAQPRSIKAYSSHRGNSRRVLYWPQRLFLYEYIPSLRRQRRLKNYDYGNARSKYRVSNPRRLILEGVIDLVSQFVTVRLRYLPRSIMDMEFDSGFRLASFVGNIRILRVTSIIRLAETRIRYHCMSGGSHQDTRVLIQ